MSVEISHTEKSFSDAMEVELSFVCPTYILFSTYDSSLTPQNVTKDHNDILLKVIFPLYKYNFNTFYSFQANISFI